MLSRVNRSIAAARKSQTRLLTVAAAAKQLAALPEYIELETTVPVGAQLARGHAGDVRAARSAAICDRVGDITQSLPLEYRLAHVARAAAACESTRSLARASAHLDNCSAAVAIAASQSALEDALVPAAAAVCLAAARARTALSDPSKDPLALVQQAISLGHRWGERLVKPPVKCDVDGELLSTLGLKTVVAYAHVLGVYLQAFVEDPQVAHAALRSGSRGAPAAPPVAAGPGESTSGSNSSGSTPEATLDEGPTSAVDLHWQATQTLCAHIGRTADIVADSHEGAFDVETARLVAILRSLAAVISISAKQNLAAAHFVLAYRLVSEPVPGGGVVGGEAEYKQAHSRITAAHALLQDAKEEVNRGLHSLEGLQLSDQSSALVRVLGEVGVDLRRHSVHVASSIVDASLLSSLWGLWLASPLNPLPASVSTGSASHPPLFPLRQAEQHAIEPVLATVTAGAQAALKQAEALPPEESSACGLDFGLPFTDGVARALRTIATLQFMAEKPVMGEGLLRGALDRYALVQVRECASFQPNDQVQRIGEVKGLPLQLQASVAGVLSVYSHLLQQWDRREGEAETAALAAHKLWSSALMSRNLRVMSQMSTPGSRAGDGASEKSPPPQTVLSTRVHFLVDNLAYMAILTPHVGSFSCMKLLNVASDASVRAPGAPLR